MSRFYLAARYGRHAELVDYARQLEEMGHIVTSRWLKSPAEPDDGMSIPDETAAAAQADVDLEDICEANVLVLFTEPPVPGSQRGGRHFEAGFACGVNLFARHYHLVVVGPRENIFYCLPGWLQYDTFADFLSELKEADQEYERLKEESNGPRIIVP